MTDLDKLIQLSSADPISDELLAAYIDGNTSEEENNYIESFVPKEDLNDISELVADSQSFEDELHCYDGDYGFWELGIPPVLGIKGNISTTPSFDESATTINEDIIAQQDMHINDVDPSGINANLDDINEFNNIDN